MVKKASDKSVNKQLTNFFQPLAEKNDESEHPMQDVTEGS
jgi:hypothetical protein